MQEDEPAQEVHELMESFASSYRAQRETELETIGARFSDRGERLADAIGRRTDVDELKSALRTLATSGPTDGTIIAAVLEKYGEVVFGAAAELDLNPKAVADELASALGLARIPTPLGPFFTFELAGAEGLEGGRGRSKEP